MVDILIVEDNAEMAFLLRDFLQAVGVVGVVAHHAAHAACPDVVLVEVPGGGWQDPDRQI